MKKFDYLSSLEAESIYIFREIAGQFKNPVLLFSGGKDSIVMTRLAEKAFRPGKFPFPLMLIDTGHNFPETVTFIKQKMADLNEKLIIGSVQDSINAGRVKEEKGPYASRNRLQSVTLMDAILSNKFDAVIGGGRRDEEKARAKERVFSVRNEFGEWDPKGQRPELWNIFNGKIDHGAHVRVFPLSNWTEVDVWQYIQKENLSVPSLYFTHQRKCVMRDNAIISDSEFIEFLPHEREKMQEMTIRFRTVGDMTCTAAMASSAMNVQDIIEEIQCSRLTERGLRVDDKRSESSMEDRKKEGYF
jgi:sulfate adenylyltransferase subunit 2